MAATTANMSTNMFEAQAILFTRTGERIQVRPVTAEDRPLLVSFFEHLPAEDIRFRFLDTAHAVDGARIDALCRADYPTSLTFLALNAGKLVAIATLAGASPEKIEVALCTLPKWKGHGVSWTLLEHAIRFAREHGAKQIISVEHGDNHAAIQLEHEMGFGIRLLDVGAGDVMAVKAI